MSRGDGDDSREAAVLLLSVCLSACWVPKRSPRFPGLMRMIVGAAARQTKLEKRQWRGGSVSASACFEATRPAVTGKVRCK